MAEYYGEYKGQHEECRRRSVWMLLLDSVMTLLTLVTTVVMALTFFVPFVTPANVWFFPVLGLAAPATYIATVLLAFYWIIRWRLIRAGVMFALVVFGLFNVSLFYKPELRRNYGEAAYDRAAFKIMTYNVRCFYGENGQSSADNVLRLIVDQDPDVVCIQEYNSRLAEASEQLALFDEKFENVIFGRTQAPDSLYGSSLAIFSKYRILRSGTVLSADESVWADVLMGDDTVRIFNNHLRSTAIKAADGDYLASRRFLSDTASETKLRSIVKRLRENSVLRAAQVDSIASVIASTPTRKIVTGDFNDTPMSYVYRTMADGLNDAFREVGAGYSHTYRGFCNMLRIDYVLPSEGFESLSYEVPDVNYSDHYPVVVRLKKTVETI